jgi:hypothetical protein
MTATDLTNAVTAPPVALFDPALGTLNSVTITFQGGENSSFVLKNTAPGSETFAYQESLNYYLNNSNSAIGALISSLAPTTVNVNNPSITLASGQSISYGPFTASTSVGSVTITNAAELALFEGVGNLSNFLVTTKTFTSYSGGGGNESTSDTSFADSTITVDYSYDANPPAVTPEPGTLGLLGTGILGMAAVLRRRFLQRR